MAGMRLWHTAASLALQRQCNRQGVVRRHSYPPARTWVEQDPIETADHDLSLLLSHCWFLSCPKCCVICCPSLQQQEQRSKFRCLQIQ